MMDCGVDVVLGLGGVVLRCYGVVWCCVEWSGGVVLVWYGVVWCGVDWWGVG